MVHFVLFTAGSPNSDFILIWLLQTFPGALQNLFHMPYDTCYEINIYLPKQLTEILAN